MRYYRDPAAVVFQAGPIPYAAIFHCEAARRHDDSLPRLWTILQSRPDFLAKSDRTPHAGSLA
jgi:hypothetical protein